MARLTLDLLRKAGRRDSEESQPMARSTRPRATPLTHSLPPLPPHTHTPQRCEHQAGSPLAALAEAPLSHCGLEDFAAGLAAHCRRVRQVHLQGNVVGRLDREAMGKLKVCGMG